MIIITGGTGQLGSQIVEQLLERVPADAGRRQRSRHRPGRRTWPHAASACDAATSPTRTPSPGRSRARPRCSSSRRTTGRGGGRPAVAAIAAAGTPVPSGSSTPATRPPARIRCSRRCPTTPPPSSTCRRRAAVHVAAQRVLRQHRPPPARPGAGDRRTRRAGRRPGVLDHARRPRRGGRDHPRRRGPVRRAHPAADRTGRARPRGHRRHPLRADRTHASAGSSPTTTSGRETMIGHGVPEDQASMLLGMFLASRRGEFATTDPTLEQLLGRPAQSIRSGAGRGSPAELPVRTG